MILIKLEFNKRMSHRNATADADARRFQETESLTQLLLFLFKMIEEEFNWRSDFVFDSKSHQADWLLVYRDVGIVEREPESMIDVD